MNTQSRLNAIKAILIWLSIAWLGSAQAQDVQVDSANPNTAEQGTLDLDIEISGNGFDNSAAVDFFVTGTTNPGGITVKNIRVRGSKKIIATIDVTEGATVDDFDIEVRLSSGRKGKGTTLFKVQAKPNGKPSDEYTATNDGVQFISPSDVAGFDYHIVGTSGGEDIIAGPGKDLIEGYGNRDFLYGRANDDVIFGGDGGDILEGEEGDDELYGESDSDWIYGGPGTDVLHGGPADDFLHFSLGRFTGTEYELDVFDGGPDLGDAILFSNDPDVTGVIVDLALGSYEATVQNTAIGTITVTGSLISIDAVVGSGGDDLLLGTPGNDSGIYPDRFGGIVGSGGDDVIYGYAGNDELVGDGGNDVLYGGPGDDLIRGDGGFDVIYGEDGNDIIELYADDGSPDEISGGSGCDKFIFAGKFGTDTITDFEDSCDIIDLNKYNPKFRLDFGDLSISTSGGDILISFWIQKQGGTGGTIILKDGATNGLIIDQSMFVF